MIYRTISEFANQIMRNKTQYSSKMVAKANFAKNARTFKHKKK